MLNWLFKRHRAAEPAPAPAPPPPAALQTPEQRRAPWQARLDAARGDDTALLALAREAPILEIKLAAVESLAAETALGAAEREFRRHDRRVHRLAKQRLVAVVARRESRAKAAALIDAARLLAADPVLPLNRLAQIDREWQALDARALEPGQADAFAVARAALETLVHEREAQRRREREARQAAALGTRADIPRAPDPVDDATAAGAERQDTAAQTPSADASARASARASAGASAAAEPVPDEPPGEMPGAASEDTAPAPEAASESAPARRRARAASREQIERVEPLLARAEAAAAEGHLAPLTKAMAELDSALDALAGATLPAPLRDRRLAVAGEFARLRSWQQWGSARAVDALVDAAEALAKTVGSAGDAEAADKTPLNLDTHAAAIRELRARWKALAHQQAAAGAAQWKRFDAALQAAYAPLAERQATIDAQRRDNLAARTALLDALDALAAEPAEGTTPAEHWRTLGRALDRFRADWRALGPVEHRVPRDARQAIHERMRHGIARLEVPLTRARRAAAEAREPLIGAAEALAADAATPLREASARARELQAEWASQSRELPLAHAVENALWTRFRAAIDAVYARRDAAAQAADAERSALVAERESLISRLAAIDADTPTPEARRTLAEVDAAWRDAPDWPRGAAGAGAGLAQRFAQARAAVQALIDDAAGRRWRSICDTLAERLALCEARETGADDAGDDAARQARWDALGASVPAWDAALTQRWTATGMPVADPAAIDDALLRLEASLDLPSPPELAQTRRTLKLTALKDTLEGRAAPASEPTQRAAWLLSLIGRPCAQAAQRARLKAVVDALRGLSSHALQLSLPRD